MVTHERIRWSGVPGLPSRHTEPADRGASLSSTVITRSRFLYVDDIGHFEMGARSFMTTRRSTASRWTWWRLGCQSAASHNGKLGLHELYVCTTRTSCGKQLPHFESPEGWSTVTDPRRASVQERDCAAGGSPRPLLVQEL
jgi:hypothetical protein